MNLRIAGGPTDDPMYPHVSWPMLSVCQKCYNEDGTFNTNEVLKYLTEFYNEDNISYEHILVKEKADDLR